MAKPTGRPPARPRAEQPAATAAPQPPPSPSTDRLHAAAVAHLARYGTTRAGLARVLQRRVARWERAAAAAGMADVDDQATAAREAIAAIVGGLADSGAVDDDAFAEARARRLARAGRSRRAIAAHLAAKGVDAVSVDAALGHADAELAAAAAAMRRRRIGPFRAAGAADGAAECDRVRRELGALARAGFSRATATAALALDRETAEALIRHLRQP